MCCICGGVNERKREPGGNEEEDVDLDLDLNVDVDVDVDRLCDNMEDVFRSWFWICLACISLVDARHDNS